MKDDELCEETSSQENIEIVEIDCSVYLTDEQRSWPIAEGLRPAEDFAIEEPLPMLVMTPARKDPKDRESGLTMLVATVSDYEASLGGEGSRLVNNPCVNGSSWNGSIALVPWKAVGARDRLELVARWAVDVSKFAIKASVA
jgi:hypothetical protein